MPDEVKRGRTRPKSLHGSHGPGYGGPAKGAGSTKPAAPRVTAGNKLAAGPHDLSSIATREEMLGIITDVARRSSNDLADKWLDRTEGKAVARNINVEADDVSALDDHALAERKADLERGLREGADGAASPVVPPVVPGVRH